MSSLRRKRRTPEQIIAHLREADGMLSGGQTIAQVCQKLSVSEPTYHRWRTSTAG
jgi:transposase-like protein